MVNHQKQKIPKLPTRLEIEQQETALNMMRDPKDRDLLRPDIENNYRLLGEVFTPETPSASERKWGKLNSRQLSDVIMEQRNVIRSGKKDTKTIIEFFDLLKFAIRRFTKEDSSFAQQVDALEQEATAINLKYSVDGLRRTLEMRKSRQAFEDKTNPKPRQAS